MVVPDINAARAELIDRGVEVGEVEELGGVLYAPSVIRTGTAGTCNSYPISLFTVLP